MPDPADNPGPALSRPQPLRAGVMGLARRLRRRKEASRPSRAPLAALLVLLAVLLACAWPFVKAHLEAVAVLDLVANKPVPALVHELATGPITTQDLEIPTSQGLIRARLYLPTRHPDAPGLVLLHGVHYLGINEPRLVGFAAAMASCGLRVLTPELPDIKDYHIGANSIATIGESTVWLARRTGHPVGVMGLSFAGGLALLAAADPRFQPSFRFVVAVGSQDEISRVDEYYRTGEDRRPNGTEEILPPNDYGALVLEYENLQDFAPAADLAPLRAVLRAHLYEDSAGEKAALAALTPQQQAEATQLMDTDSPTTRRALAQSEVKHIAAMAGVSPHDHLAHLPTPVYLLAGEADDVIPSAETLWLEQELTGDNLRAALISPVLSHVSVNGGNGTTELDRLRLVHFFALILHAAHAR